MNNDNKRLIWTDVETTGLDEERHELLEVAVVITDSQLNELCNYSNVLWRPAGLEGRCSPAITQMHGPDRQDYNKPCLLEEVRAAKLEADDAQKDLLRLFHFHGVEPCKGILAGASVHFDRRFLKKNMPLLEAFLYHRMFDISALKTAAQMWNPSILPPAPKGHRALADVRAAVALAKVFKPIIENALVGLVAGDSSIEGFIHEIARDFGDHQPTKTEVLTRRLRELVQIAKNDTQPKLGPEASYGD